MTRNDESADIAELYAAVPVGIAQIDSAQRYVHVNDRYCEMAGQSRAQLLASTITDAIAEADPAEETAIANGLRYGTPAHVVDAVLRRPDGTTLPVEYWVRPLSREGKTHSIVCTFVDLTERKKIESVNSRELSHRIKNIFAMAQAIVGQTLRSAASQREGIHTISQRLAALSNANAVLLRTQGHASLADVVDSAVAMHRPEAHRIVCEGPSVTIGSKGALAITLALHELCTNATKYGALSNESGHVRIDWTVEDHSPEKMLRMQWEERGGPPVAEPAHKGFGSRLIIENVGSDLHGRGQLSFDPLGVTWALQAPLSALKD